MARVFTILLVCVYALSATGASVHLHYCCGKLQKLALQDEKKPGHDDCPLCLKQHASEKDAPLRTAETCCKDDSCAVEDTTKGGCQNLKVDAKKTTTEHLTGADNKTPKVHPIELLVFSIMHLMDLKTLATAEVPNVTDSPPGEDKPLFIKHCSYLI